MEVPTDDPYPSLGLVVQTIEASLPYEYVFINVAAMLLLILMSALISGSEVAYFSLKHGDLEECKENATSANRAILALVGDRRRLLATILIMNNLVNVAIVTLATFFTWRLVGTRTPGGQVLTVLTLTVTFVILFFGEVVPKNYATKHNLQFARLTAGILLFFRWVLKYPALFLINVTNMIERHMERKTHNITVDELNQALEITTDENTTDEEKGILKGIVNFSTLTVKQIMHPRLDITAIDIEHDFHELMDKINKSGFSRIPVFSETIDKIEGILYIKDLLAHIDKDENFKWQELLRQGYFVPENKKVDSLLKNFQDKRVHMAIVVDEYGGTSGLITMEDIIEEIVGEINDEFDDEDVAYNKLDASTYIFEGKTSLNDLCKIIEADPSVFDEVKGESESLGGLLLELFSKLPKAGEKKEFGSFLFTVVAVDERRIKRVRILVNRNTLKEL